MKTVDIRLPQRPFDMLRFEIFQSESQIKDIAREWNEIVAEQNDMPYGLGPTSTCELATLAREIHVPLSDPRIFVARDKHGIAAILPGFALKHRAGPLSYTTVGLSSDLYPGRTGIIYRPERQEVAEMLIRETLAMRAAWDVLEITYVAGSTDEQMFLNQIAEQELFTNVSEVTSYPYLEFPPRWEDLFESFSKKFRYNVRSREKKLGNEGEIQVCRFDSTEEVIQFMTDVELIEKNSWKESAGTSLTQNPAQHQFHLRMSPICAASGTLRSYVMYLGHEPIAHIIGLYANRIFYCLKSSFADHYRKFSPGVILKTKVMQELIEDGAKYWDFVGPAEDHKMQWTKSTYTLNRYSVYSHTLTARLLRLRADIGRRLRSASAGQKEADAVADVQ